MAIIKPFKGILYNEAKAGHLSKLVTPPYDVISQTMQKRYHDANPYNIIRLILGRETKKDTKTYNKYTRAAQHLKNWLKKNIFTQDKKPAIYIYQETYFYEGEKRTRTGFIALMKIEDPQKSGVLPHEYTLQKPKTDRFNLIKKVKANLSPIFSLYSDSKFTISKVIKSHTERNKPVFQINFEGVTHKLWRLEDPAKASLILKAMAGKKIFIADGHHRYEVALMYKKLINKRKSHNRNADFVMMYFANLSESDNITILSTHRLFKNIGDIGVDKILENLKPAFNIRLFKNPNKLLVALTNNRKHPSFGMYAGDKNLFLLRLKKHISIPKVIKDDKSSEWKRLDVAILHNFILKNLLSFKDSEDNIKYVREPEHVIRLVDSGLYRIAFFLNPTKVHQVKEVAEKGDMMPQKSTYFYPKLLTGLVINKF